MTKLRNSPQNRAKTEREQIFKKKKKLDDQPKNSNV